MITVREAITEKKIPEFLAEIAEDDRWESDDIAKVFHTYLTHEESAVYDTLLQHTEKQELTAALLPLLPDHDEARAYVIKWSGNEDLAETLIRYVDLLRDARAVTGWKHTVTENVFVELGPGTVEDPSEEFMYCYAPDYETRDFVNLATRLKESQLEEL